MSYYFEEPIDVKLIIIRTIRYFRDAIPESILTDTILVNGYVNYFDLEQAIYELTESRLITYYEDGQYGRRFSLTSLGETALEGFAARLPKSVCEKLYQTVRVKIREFENELAVTAEYEKGSEEEYTVRLGISEGKYEIMKLSISLFDERLAKNLCREFKRSPQTYYNEVLSIMLNEPKG